MRTKAKYDLKTFFQSDEIKTPTRCQDNYLRFDRGKAQLTPYNSANMSTSMVSNSTCFCIGKQLSFSTSAVQRVSIHYKWKFYSHDFTSVVKCRRHHQEDGVRLPSCWDLKDERKGKRKHIEIHEEAAMCSAQDL